tara:strand:- start:420 stop:593 length:174 start_codon:yes stop_codon:yes gene_type:complete
MKNILILGGGFGGIFCAILNSLVLKIQAKSFKPLAEDLSLLKNYIGVYLPRTFKILT